MRPLAPVNEEVKYVNCHWLDSRPCVYSKLQSVQEIRCHQCSSYARKEWTFGGRIASNFNAQHFLRNCMCTHLWSTANKANKCMQFLFTPTFSAINVDRFALEYPAVPEKCYLWNKKNIKNQKLGRRATNRKLGRFPCQSEVRTASSSYDALEGESPAGLQASLDKSYYSILLLNVCILIYVWSSLHLRQA